MNALRGWMRIWRRNLENNKSVYKRLTKVVLCTLAIGACILMDNYVDIPYTMKYGTGSVFYYFFGSIAFGGLFGVYLTPCLCVFPWYSNDENSKCSLKNVTGRILKCGATLAVGYLFLFCLLRMKTPFITESEREAMCGSDNNGGYFAYLELFDHHHDMLYFVIAIWFGFIEGCLSGTVAEIAMYFNMPLSFVIMSPSVTLLYLVYFCKYVGIPDELRFDRWLLMRMTINDSVTTIAAVTVVSVIFVFMTVFTLERRSEQKSDRSSKRGISLSHKALYFSAIVVLFIIILRNELMPITIYLEKTSQRIAPFSFLFIMSEPFFQMIYMMLFVCTISGHKLQTKSAKTIADRSLFSSALKTIQDTGRVIMESLLLSCSIFVLSVLILNRIDFSSVWGNVWEAFAMQYNSILTFDIPISIMESHSPIFSSFMLFLLTNLCSICLGMICICGNKLHAGLGSVIATSFCFLDITAYNLLEPRMYSFSLLSWAQYAQYVNGKTVNGFSVQYVIKLYIATILVTILLTICITYFRAVSKEANI